MAYYSDSDGESTTINLGTYEGERNADGQRHGKGVATLPSGDTYDGEYVNGKREGYGTYTYIRDEQVVATYQGDWLANKRHGHGVLTQGDVQYEGEFANGHKHGFGLYRYANGDTYEGAWKDNLKHGRGTYEQAESGCVFHGDWRAGLLHSGTLALPDGTLFHGHFRDGLPIDGAYQFHSGNWQQGVYKLEQADLDDEFYDDPAYDDEPTPSTQPTLTWLANDYGNLHKQTPLWKKRVIFVLGGPGSGKGTQCKKITAAMPDEVCHLSAGDLLRAEAADRKSEHGWQINFCMKNGLLVPAEVTIALLRKAMLANDAHTFLIDGFPRELQQGFDFEAQIQEADFVIFFDCPESELTNRIMARAKASGDHARVDDNLTALKKRFATYQKQTLPVIDYYRSVNKVHTIDATGSIDDIFEATLPLIEDHEHE